MEDLARELHMSVSAMCSWFRSVTGISPLQFQKQLRLQEARRLMLAEQLEAGDAGRRVGYRSASQFSREYGGFFGAPSMRAMRDIERLKT
jgi:AraC-like DNA-binding protein